MSAITFESGFGIAVNTPPVPVVNSLPRVIPPVVAFNGLKSIASLKLIDPPPGD